MTATAKQLHPPRRERNGQRQRSTVAQIEAAERAREDRERATVLAQPHRNGETSQLAECALGRFVLQYALARELFDAGVHYAEIRGKWRAYILAPVPDRISGSGLEISKKTADKWDEMLRDWEREMRQAGGGEGLSGVVCLCCDNFDLPLNADRLKVIAALTALAKAQGRI